MAILIFAFLCVLLFSIFIDNTHMLEGEGRGGSEGVRRGGEGEARERGEGEARERGGRNVIDMGVGRGKGQSANSR